MGKKAKTLYALYEETLFAITHSDEAWKAFLKSTAFNFGLPFDEQVLVYAQRPDATAVLTTKDWNRRYGRWIQKGSKGIAVFDKESNHQGIKYYFDIADTDESYFEELVRPVPLWTMQRNDEEAIRKELSTLVFFDLPSKSFELFLKDLIICFTEVSMTDEWTTDMVGTPVIMETGDADFDLLKNMVIHSVTYQVATRLGYAVDVDLNTITRFTTPEQINNLGVWVSDLTEILLYTAAKTIRDNHRTTHSIEQKVSAVYNEGTKEKSETERGGTNDGTQLHETGRLPDARPERERNTTSNREMGDVTGKLSEDRSVRSVPELPDDRDTRGTSYGNPGDSGKVDDRDDRKDGKRSGDNRSAQRERSAYVDADNERDHLSSGRNHPGGTHYDHLKAVLTTTPYLRDNRQTITRIFKRRESLDERVNYLKKIVHSEEKTLLLDDDTTVRYHAEDDKGIVLWWQDNEEVYTWEQTITAIETLIADGTWLRQDKTNEASDTQLTFIEAEEEIPSAFLMPEQESYKHDVVDNAEKDEGKIQDIESDIGENFNLKTYDLPTGTPKERLARNIEALEVLHACEDANRPATDEEKEKLAMYVGWGGLADAFDHDKWPEANERLKTLLTDYAYEQARASTLTAFYTPKEVTAAMYQAFEQFGLKTGKLLEPSCGIGNFIGMRPDSMEGISVDGVELDSVSGRIAALLYPEAKIHVQGFETVPFLDNSFDAAIGNIPFGDFSLTDSRYQKEKFLIHDYFFAKTLDLLKPGGILAFITSKGTLDKKNPSVRKYLAERAELIGAVRLPDNTFKGNAGTEVTSDIVFLKKRERPVVLESVDAPWVYLHEDEEGRVYNQYYALHPEMVLGNLVLESGPYGPVLACKKRENSDLQAELAEAINRLDAVFESDKAIEATTDLKETLPADPRVRNYSFTVVDTALYYRVDHHMQRVETTPFNTKRIQALIDLARQTRKLIDAEMNDEPDVTIKKMQASLNVSYDHFVKTYGRINAQGNARVFREDSSYPLLCSLEVLDSNRRFLRKSDFFSKRTIKSKQVVTSVETAKEALAVSLSEKGGVDLAYMATLLTPPTDQSNDLSDVYQQMITELKGIIFKDPRTGSPDINTPKGLKGWETADAYLSGNVREKLAMAEAKAREDPFFTTNVDALEKVKPEWIDAEEITVRLGTTWIPEKTIEAFVFELLETPGYAQGDIRVHYFDFNSEWRIEGKTRDAGNVKANSVFGTRRKNAYTIIEETLNLRESKVFDTVIDADGKERRVLNQQETLAVMEKQEAIKNAFQEWIFKDTNRKDELTAYYNETYNAIRPRQYDGSHLHFEGMNPEITLRPHQKNAIARIVYGGNTLLAHVVGAGKTYTMIAAAMEMKRIGLCQKSMVVVPNHLVGQFANEWLQLYPGANLLVTTKRDFEKSRRREFVSRIATGDYDAVIISHSQFGKIPLNPEKEQAYLQEEVSELTKGIHLLKAERGERVTIKAMEKTRKKLNEKIKKLSMIKHQDNTIYFDELGIDRLFIDEADEFKNLYVYSKMQNVGGISQTESQKASDLFNKTRYLNEKTGEKGVIFATGTPISNSMVELYTMQRYLQYNTLKRMNLLHFDAWASTFGETITALELAPEGTNYRMKTRFAKFYNVPELMQIFWEVADIQTADMLKLPVPKAHYEVITTKPSDEQKAILEALVERAEKVRNREVDAQIDNMLCITNDGRKLALDARLINDLLPDDPGSKVNACINNVFHTWQETREKALTQLVFCDLSTPKKDSFDVYHAIKEKLTVKGVPEEEIAFIHDYTTDVAKQTLFANVRKGAVRIVLGSTAKLGAGTNIQDKMIKLHDLDCPWRPRDLEQRAGRIVRQGNQNEEVYIMRYITEGTFDAYSYQLIENKQRFIAQIMTGKTPARVVEDIDTTALSYAEIKALASGNPEIKEKMDLEIEVAKLENLRRSYNKQRTELKYQLTQALPKEIKWEKERIAKYEEDAKNVTPKQDKSFTGMTLLGDTYDDKNEAGEMLLKVLKTTKGFDQKEVGSYRGLPFSITYRARYNVFTATFHGKADYETQLGNTALGNITRFDNLLDGFDERIDQAKARYLALQKQLEDAKSAYEKPFDKEDVLKAKTARLNELNQRFAPDVEDAVVLEEEESIQPKTHEKAISR